MQRLLILSCLFFSTFLSAQNSTINHQSINLGGGSSGMVSYSIGQTAITTLFGDESSITQGFQQPEVKLGTSINEVLISSANIYPNPVTEFVNIDLVFKSKMTGQLNLLSIDGRILNTSNFDNNINYSNKIDLSLYPPGMYILQVESDQGNTIYTQRLIKYQ